MLDLSHNSIGSDSKKLAGKEIVDACGANKSGIRHLDLSYNGFKLMEIYHI